MNETIPETIDQVIRQRKTTKVLAEKELAPDPNVINAIDELIAVAGWAPFHRPCDPLHREHRADGLDGLEPWRFYVLLATECRRLREVVRDWSEAGKIPSMLAAASGLVLATWLPNPPSDSSDADAEFEPTIANMEHIAAASAAIQNLLLAATARGIPTYWSSGGVLRSPQCFELLGIPIREILLGAVFLFPTQTDTAEVVGSKLRSKRMPPAQWSRRIRLDLPK